jgi:N-acetylglucosamine-6-sulfatase
MKRSLVVIALALVASVAVDVGGDVAATARPNVIVVLTDDQTYDSLGAMPYLMSMPSGHWTRFTNAFVTTPLCCPSRATMLSGQYSHRHGVVDNATADRLEESTLLPVWFEAAGYRTALFGKYFNGYPFGRAPYVPPGWDEWAAGIGFYDFKLHDNGQPVRTEPAYSTRVFTDRALQFIDEDPASPFFVLMSYSAGHAPFTPEEKYKTLDVAVPQLRASFNEPDVRDKPRYIRTRAKLTHTQTSTLSRDRRNAFRTLRSVDDSLRRILNKLTAHDVLDDTVVIVMSDNGLPFGEHRLFNEKMAPYESNIRVPLLVRHPDLGPENRTITRFVDNTDVSATIADIANLSPTRPLDGKSLLGLLSGSNTSWTDEVLLHWAGGETGDIGDALGLGGITPYWGVRNARWKYIEYETGERELYDLKVDPHELTNLANKSAYNTQERGLADRLAAVRP